LRLKILKKVNSEPQLSTLFSGSYKKSVILMTQFGTIP